MKKTLRDAVPTPVQIAGQLSIIWLAAIIQQAINQLRRPAFRTPWS